jgi:hypothetical protein
VLQQQTWLPAILEAGADEQALAQQLREGGYAALRSLIEEVQERIKRFEDEEAEETLRLIEAAARLAPEPGRVSPAWQTVWEDLRTMAQQKIKALRTVPPEERDGEWQVILDNPYVHQQIVCYPGLSFLEAAYLFGYFKTDLKRNEYVRLQKIVTVIMDFGG